jgi:hypothetical protein
MTEQQDDLQADGGEEDDPGWPISFLLLVGAGALYLILRLVQLIQGIVT